MEMSRDDSKLSSVESTCAFLDTMIFLHFQPFDQLDWTSILNAKHVTIVIPPIILRELNKHKDNHPLSKIRDRAQRVIGRVLELFKDAYTANVRRGIDVMHEPVEPKLDFEAHNLDPKSGDDVLLAAVLYATIERPDTNVVIVTDDPNLILKSRQYGIATLRLSKDFKLPDVLDGYQREIQELERTVQELKNRSPLLRLGFDTGSDHVTFTLIRPSVTTEEEIEQAVRELQDQYPKMPVPDPGPVEKSPPKKGVSLLELAKLFEAFGGYTVQERVDYNAKLDKFFSAYRDYLRRNSEYLDIKARTIALDILVHNEGTAPGEDLDIHMHFPDGFSLATDDVKRPTKPRPPKAQTTMERMQETIRAPYLNSAAYLPRPVQPYRPSEPPNVSRPNIRRSKSYEVDFTLGRLKHNQPICLDQLFIVFDSFESAGSFGIEYGINAGNVPHEVKGTLHIIVERT